mmetsp:Transcript_41071/g.98993  ORF Transcript_41071/g.98993 Transcript_41071/m.98993 type:complete len:156 (+) Transcript_41071:335-802(+)
MTTTTDTGCQIWGAWNICPASTDFDFDGQKVDLEAELFCPLNSVTKSNFIDASQKGHCECHASLVGTTQPMDCNCFVCPQGSRIGFAYDCDQRIFGPCTQFNCAGECNGRFSFGLDAKTEAPTPVIISGTSSHGTDSLPMTLAMSVLTIYWMMRH